MQERQYNGGSMKEIKFRVWDEKNKCFECWGHMEKGVFKSIPTGYSIGSIDEVVSNSEQYTGLTDKNGVRIYEGDVVYVAGVGNCAVIYNEGLASYVFNHDDCDWQYWEILEDKDSLLVIGNIHEVKDDI